MLSRRTFGAAFLAALAGPMTAFGLSSSKPKDKKPARIIVQNHDGKIMAEVQPGEGKTIVWKIGSDERPATDEDIQDFMKNLSAVCADPSLMIVTHHMVSAVVIPA